jgi:hypothetical protein
MTSDQDVAKLLGAVEASGARAIVVGDYRQLDAVGPGGALEALASRHPGHVWTLRDNMRQRDPAERGALDHLRAGHVPGAVGWYLRQGRLHPAHDRAHAMSQMVKSWAYDVAEGKDALLVAYHRDAVETLNRAAREIWERLGRLAGPELEAPGGRRYRAGDRVVTLAPGPAGAWATSQRAVVASVDPEARSLVALTPEGTELHMGPEAIGADKLAHSYAVTAHRSQGQTVDVTYALEDGGGRELAYVAMSRARGESHVHVVAPSLAEAAQRLAWAWGQERRQAWVLDHDDPRQRLAQLYRERQELSRSLPPDRSADLERSRRQLGAVEQDRADLYAGAGRWAATPVGDAARALRRAAAEHQHASERLDGQDLGLWARRKARQHLSDARARFEAAAEAWDRTGRPEADGLEAYGGRLAGEVEQLHQAQQARQAFLVRHPEAPYRVAELDRAIEHEEGLERRRNLEQLLERGRAQQMGVAHERGTALGIDL